ncbi:hypothetical protein EG349_17835 [Chryseobacterium shandongense]|jgi:hypothetical protein|uniref:DUF5683 domain-containing protein n=1 Tax=Chryseobacterium shandongense TaxID=1493872 RepID=A0A3G6R195_9FLAO|nr:MULTISPECIES: DUF5683 domain-containing protein [Chryseobacterium]AZA56718.1 hypothetical protein EG350_05825 [Chryseobacterium shandongense]AZA88496.1 hypothetical protein EG349_17835 [Chryseobacterium shandongense]AZA97038.1 hypothetical protein EG353_16535 [Chryseobacterium shandongense]
MKKLLFTFFLSLSVMFFSQVNPNDTIRVEYHPKDSVSVEKNNTLTEENVVSDLEKANGPTNNTLKLNPTKAGLYSAVLPGLGQFYNKKYWKVPIVWGAVGAGVGIAVWNDNQYRKYREYYIAKLNGTPNEFVDSHPWLDKVALGNAQDRAKRQRDYAIAGTALIYILNIVDAVVDAHLYESRKDPDLTFTPSVIQDQYGIAPPKTGISLSYKF